MYIAFTIFGMVVGVILAACGIGIGYTIFQAFLAYAFGGAVTTLACAVYAALQKKPEVEVSEPA